MTSQPQPLPDAVTGQPPRDRSFRARLRRIPGGSGLAIGMGAILFSSAVLVPLSFDGISRTTIAFGGPPALTLAVSMTGRSITPAEIHVPRASAVRVEVKNLDGPRDGHRLKTTGQQYDVDIAVWGGLTKSETFLTARKPGRYPLLCSVRGHASEGMVAVLVVD